MTPVKCYYSNCKYTNADKSMFTFPINDEPRLKLWIENSGNKSLKSLTREELKRRFLCEEHFKPIDVLKHFSKSRLVPTAVPAVFEPPASQSAEMSFPDTLKVKIPQKVYSRKCINLPKQELSSATLIDVPLHTKHILKPDQVFNDCENKLEVKGNEKKVEDSQQKQKIQPEPPTLFNDRENKLEVKNKKKEKKLQKQNIRRHKLRHLRLNDSKKTTIILMESHSASNEAAITMATKFNFSNGVFTMSV